MDAPVLMLAYAAAFAVAALLTLGFAGSINRTLRTLIPEELAPAWSLFIKFALFVFAFAGGMPNRDTGAYVGFPTPAVALPVQGEGLALIMKSIGGALMSGTWTLLVFFSATLTAHMAGRVWVALKERREAEAKEADEVIRHREELAAGKAAQPDPPRRQAPAEPRPIVKKETAKAS
jgi:hypothetical protein